MFTKVCIEGERDSRKYDLWNRERKLLFPVPVLPTAQPHSCPWVYEMLLSPNYKSTSDFPPALKLTEVSFCCLQLKNSYSFISQYNSHGEEIIWSNVTPVAQENTVILSSALGNI